MKLKQILLSIGLACCVGLMAAPVVGAASCGGKDTIILSCGSDGIEGILLLAINILTAGIGTAAIGGIIYGSILYSSAGGSADQIKKARELIINIVIGLVAFALMWAFLNFIIPGGVFKS
ncbi:MAG: hypothetical protein WCP11_00515 [Candidatus Saccharibacteria bacterium]